jgi:hypothetical protein
MDTEAILALIADLYRQIIALQKELECLKSKDKNR